MELRSQADTAIALASTYAASLRAALVTTAIAVVNEDASHLNHEARLALAYRALRDVGSVSDAFAYAIATNTTVVDEFDVQDPSAAFADIPYVITTVWDAIALSFADASHA